MAQPRRNSKNNDNDNARSKSKGPDPSYAEQQAKAADEGRGGPPVNGNDEKEE